MRPEGPWQRRDFTRPYSCPQLPGVKSGHPNLLLPSNSPDKGKLKLGQKKGQRESNPVQLPVQTFEATSLQGGPGPPSSLSDSSPSPIPSRGLLAPQPTASAQPGVCSKTPAPPQPPSFQSSLTAGALGHFHLQSFPIRCHNLRICGARALHSTNR